MADETLHPEQATYDAQCLRLFIRHFQRLVAATSSAIPRAQAEAHVKEVETAVGPDGLGRVMALLRKGAPMEFAGRIVEVKDRYSELKALTTYSASHVRSARMPEWTTRRWDSREARTISGQLDRIDYRRVEGVAHALDLCNSQFAELEPLLDRARDDLQPARGISHGFFQSIERFRTSTDDFAMAAPYLQAGIARVVVVVLYATTSFNEVQSQTAAAVAGALASPRKTGALESSSFSESILPLMQQWDRVTRAACDIYARILDIPVIPAADTSQLDEQQFNNVTDVAERSLTGSAVMTEALSLLLSSTSWSSPLQSLVQQDLQPAIAHARDANASLLALTKSVCRDIALRNSPCSSSMAQYKHRREHDLPAEYRPVVFRVVQDQWHAAHTEIRSLRAGWANALVQDPVEHALHTSVGEALRIVGKSFERIEPALMHWSAQARGDAAAAPLTEKQQHACWQLMQKRFPGVGNPFRVRLDEAARNALVAELTQDAEPMRALPASSNASKAKRKSRLTAASTRQSAVAHIKQKRMDIEARLAPYIDKGAIERFTSARRDARQILEESLLPIVLGASAIRISERELERRIDHLLGTLTALHRRCKESESEFPDLCDSHREFTGRATPEHDARSAELSAARAALHADLDHLQAQRGPLMEHARLAEFAQHPTFRQLVRLHDEGLVAIRYDRAEQHTDRQRQGQTEHLRIFEISLDRTVTIAGADGAAYAATRVEGHAHIVRRMTDASQPYEGPSNNVVLACHLKRQDEALRQDAWRGAEAGNVHTHRQTRAAQSEMYRWMVAAAERRTETR